ncbi:MAG: hypothetical protein Q9227_000845 [Pyrenula ochraceoflavens]
MSELVRAEDIQREVLSKMGASNSAETCVFDDTFEPYGGETMELDKSQPPTPDGSGLPVNFHTIAPDIFRSSYPQLLHYNELEGLDLRTIVTLVKEDPIFSASAKTFMKKNGIKHVNLVLTPNKPNDQKPRSMEMEHGKHRTGCTSAIFRMATGWSASAATAEYVKFAGGKHREADINFIQSFDVTELKGIALDNGFFCGVYAQEYVWSSRSSFRTNRTSTDLSQY